MSDAFRFARKTRWTRQGQWGGSTLSRSLIYTGLQRRLEDWTGVREGYEGFLHAGETTYIAAGQFARFADAFVARVHADASLLPRFAQRFDALLVEVEDLLARLAQPDADCLDDYVRLHREMQPYSYVFGYGEDAIIARLVAEVVPEPLRRAAFAPPGNAEASRALRGVDDPLVPLVRRHALVRTQRRQLWNRVEDAVVPLVVARAEALGVPRAMAFDLAPEELLGREPTPTLRELRARVGGTFLAWRGRAWLFDGVLDVAPEQAPDELRGSTGHPGVVRGRARLVLREADQDAMRKGDVLVSDMTTPELMIACSRAAAIVTDRGGLLCHAAIVAREFGIPCVLATEHATRVLRDGDLVEVDATRGVVRVLERAAA